MVAYNVFHHLWSAALQLEACSSRSNRHLLAESSRDVLAAPEVVSANREKYDGKLADMWSCGVMLYVMLFHSYPFERSDDPPGHKGAAKVRPV